MTTTYDELRRIHLTLLWLTLLLCALTDALCALVYSFESPPGNVVAFMYRQNIPQNGLVAWCILSALVLVFVPVVIRRLFLFGFALYLVGSLPTLFYILESYLFFTHGVRTGSTVGLVLYAELYTLLLVIIGFTSSFLIWFRLHRPHEEPHV